jgi:hypothetical protein
MSKEKLTPVNWLISKLQLDTRYSGIYDNILNEARQMEEEQYEKLKDFDNWKDWKNNVETKSE